MEIFCFEKSNCFKTTRLLSELRSYLDPIGVDPGEDGAPDQHGKVGPIHDSPRPQIGPRVRPGREDEFVRGNRDTLTQLYADVTKEGMDN